nr:MAG TPA: hypothetical protein [Herelleviridae sp.]
MNNRIIASVLFHSHILLDRNMSNASRLVNPRTSFNLDASFTVNESKPFILR